MWQLGAGFQSASCCLGQVFATGMWSFPCISCFLHYPYEMHPLWRAKQGRCCYDRTPWSTLGNLLQAPEICGSGARSIGNSQNECQNDLAVQICLKHFLSSRERDDDPSLTSPDTSETCSNRSKLAVGFDRAAWNRIMSICCVTSVALLI